MRASDEIERLRSWLARVDADGGMNPGKGSSIGQTIHWLSQIADEVYDLEMMVKVYLDRRDFKCRYCGEQKEPLPVRTPSTILRFYCCPKCKGEKTTEAISRDLMDRIEAAEMILYEMEESDTTRGLSEEGDKK